MVANAKISLHDLLAVSNFSLNIAQVALLIYVLVHVLRVLDALEATRGVIQP